MEVGARSLDVPVGTNTCGREAAVDAQGPGIGWNSEEVISDCVVEEAGAVGQGPREAKGTRAGDCVPVNLADTIYRPCFASRIERSRLRFRSKSRRKVGRERKRALCVRLGLLSGIVPALGLHRRGYGRKPNHYCGQHHDCEHLSDSHPAHTVPSAPNGPNPLFTEVPLPLPPRSTG